MDECTNSGCCNDGCCLDASFGADDGICNCCLPGLQATLQFAAGETPQPKIAISTINTQSGVNEEGDIFSTVTTLVKFSNGDTIFPICNIELIEFRATAGTTAASSLTSTQLTTLINAVNIPTPEECSTCCSEELREFLQSFQTSTNSTVYSKKVTRIDSNANILVSGNNNKIRGTGLGVVILEKTANKTISVVNLCFVSQIKLLNNP